MGKALIETDGGVLAQKIDPLAAGFTHRFADQRTRDPAPPGARVDHKARQVGLKLAVAEHLREPNHIALLDSDEGRDAVGRQSAQSTSAVFDPRRPSFTGAQLKDLFEITRLKRSDVEHTTVITQRASVHGAPPQFTNERGCARSVLRVGRKAAAASQTLAPATKQVRHT